MVRRLPRIGASWVSPDTATSRRYLRAIGIAGGEPVPLLAGAVSWQTELDGIDGLVLTGGGDLCPSLYSEQDTGHCQRVDKRRDELEVHALNSCLGRGKPVLAICRGMQLVNVVLGGSLVQELNGVVEHRAIDGWSSFHTVGVTAGTRLAAMAGPRERVWVNSRHHQGITPERVAGSLCISGMSADGVVEGLEFTSGLFLVAMQFHPERSGEVPYWADPFAALVAEA